MKIDPNKITAGAPAEGPGTWVPVGASQRAPNPSTSPARDDRAPGATDTEALGTSERFQPRTPHWTVDDVILSDATRRDVLAMLAKFECHEVLYNTWNLKKLEPAGRKLVVNLYGLPGTGKTMLADAIAQRLGKTILEVSYAEIESKYVGETPKNIVAAFEAAKANGSAIFFDEADSILGRRMTNVTAAADHGVNVSRAVMLKQLDAFDGVVLFATNLAKNFDGAFVRRILFHLEVPPPDLACRRVMWRKLVPTEVPGSGELDFDELAARSDGLVGGEIKNCILLAATVAVQRVDSERVLKMPDLFSAIEQTAKAKRDIGRYDYNESRAGD
jgi:SpoVK/Ycf46/Vps4 family AAA+-type ATPase